MNIVLSLVPDIKILLQYLTKNAYLKKCIFICLCAVCDVIKNFVTLLMFDLCY